MSDLPKIPATAKEVIKIKEQAKYMLTKLILIMMLLIPILILLWMTLDKTLKLRLLEFLWGR